MKSTARHVLIIALSCLAMGIVSVAPICAQNFSNYGQVEESPEEIQALSDRQDLEILMIPTDEFNSKAQTENYMEPSSEYTLGKSDVIEITVQRHPEVSGQYPINNEGNIQYEFVGDVNVEGLKKDEVKSKINQLLSTYIVSPEVTVKIVGYNSKVVYVIGEVARPGKIFMRGDTISIREALIQAGLPLLSASLKKSKLITPSDDGKPKNVQINVDALLIKGDLRENLVMLPGDTLYVPPTGLTKVMRAIQPVAAPIGTAAGTGRTVTTGF